MSRLQLRAFFFLNVCILVKTKSHIRIVLAETYKEPVSRLDCLCFRNVQFVNLGSQETLLLPLKVHFLTNFFNGSKMDFFSSLTLFCCQRYKGTDGLRSLSFKSFIFPFCMS